MPIACSRHVSEDCTVNTSGLRYTRGTINAGFVESKPAPRVRPRYREFAHRGTTVHFEGGSSSQRIGFSSLGEQPCVLTKPQHGLLSQRDVFIVTFGLVLMGASALLPRCRTLRVSKKPCVRFPESELVSFCNRLYWGFEGCVSSAAPPRPP